MSDPYSALREQLDRVTEELAEAAADRDALREELAAAQRDVARLDYWERMPGACLSAVQSWWATAGAGFRENYQNIRHIIDSVQEEHGEPAAMEAEPDDR